MIGCSEKKKHSQGFHDKEHSKDGPVYPAPLNASTIDNQTIAAYEKLGARYGGFVIGPFRIAEFAPGTDAAAKGLPAFDFGSPPDSQLPPVRVPFGINLNFRKVTDAALKNLNGLKNITTLDLALTNVTDAGLRN